MRLSPTLSIELNGAGASVCCAGCSHRLEMAGRPWKPKAVLRERPVRDLGGVHACAAEHVVLREFFCPSCRALLDTETALKGDPFLEDVLMV